MHVDRTDPARRLAPHGGPNPLDRVFELGATDRRRALSLALAAALLAHAGMAGGIRLKGDQLGNEAAAPTGDEEFAIEREVPPPPPLPAPEPPPAPPPEPPKVANVTAPAPDPNDPPEEMPASEAAQAGEILAQDSDEDEEDTEDSDENTFVIGDAGTYAGGVTAATGRSTVAVRGAVVAGGGVPGGTGTRIVAPKPTARDLSRGAWLDGNTSWDDCDFPGEADRDRIRDAAVEMTVTVRPDGTAQSVTITDDPGHGFARTASACALKHRFAPALDAEGHKMWGTTRPFHVGFHR